MKIVRQLSLLSAALLMLLSFGCSNASDVDPDRIQASGFIEGRTYSIASTLGGRIEQILVQKGDTVREAAQLIVLDTTELEFTLEQAQAAVDAVQAEIDALRDRPRANEIAEARANVDIALAELDAAEASLDLLYSSYEPLDPPEADVNAAESAIVIAGAGLTLAQAQLAQVEAGPIEGERTVLEAYLKEAQANLEFVERQLSEFTIVAPQDGIIHELMSSEGEVVIPGAPIAYLLDPDHLILTVYIPVTQVAKVQIGDHVEITADAYQDVRFQGSVTLIADEAQFTPATVLTEEERVKLVFKVEVRIDDPSGKLKPGMPVDAVVNP